MRGRSRSSTHAVSVASVPVAPASPMAPQRKSHLQSLNVSTHKTLCQGGLGPDYDHTHLLGITMQTNQLSTNTMTTPQPTPNPQPREDPLSFELLNLLQRRLTIARSHIIAQTIMAQKDETGKVSWVEFIPEFHSHLVKRAFSLLSRPITPSARRMLKKAIFVFILEILNQEREVEFFALEYGDTGKNNAEQKKKRISCKHRHVNKQEHTCKENESPEVQPSNLTPSVNAEGHQYAPPEATKSET